MYVHFPALRTSETKEHCLLSRFFNLWKGTKWQLSPRLNKNHRYSTYLDLWFNSAAGKGQINTSESLSARALWDKLLYKDFLYYPYDCWSKNKSLTDVLSYLYHFTQQCTFWKPSNWLLSYTGCLSECICYWVNLI